MEVRGGSPSCRERGGRAGAEEHLAVGARNACGHVHGRHPIHGEAFEEVTHTGVARGRNGRGEQVAKRTRSLTKDANQRPPADDLLVAGIAPEELVRALAGEDDLHVTAGDEGTEQMQGQGYGIGEGLVLMVDETGEQCEGVLFGEGHIVVFGTEVAGHAAGVSALVVGGLTGEADGEGGGPGGELGEECEDGGGVEASAEESADGEIAEQTFLDGALEGGANGGGGGGQ